MLHIFIYLYAYIHILSISFTEIPKVDIHSYLVIEIERF